MYVRQKGKDTYYLECSSGFDKTGKRIKFYRTVHAKGKRELQKAITQFQADVDNGLVAKRKSKLTLYELCDRMLRGVISIDTKETTLRGYRISLERISQFSISKARAEEIQPSDMQEFVSVLRNAKYGKQQKPYSVKTIRSTISFISSCYDLGITASLVSHNPCKGVRLPKPDKKTARALNLDELPVFLMNLEKLYPDMRVALELALFLGMRRSEICGLRLEHIHDDYLDVCETRHFIDGKDVVQSTKTEGSEAYIALPKFLKDDIEDLLLYHEKESERLKGFWDENGYLILAPEGTPVKPGRINNTLQRYIKEIGIEHVTLHQLRHTYASLVNHFGADITELASQMRHSNAQVTLTTYTHMVRSIPESSKKYAKVMNNYRNEILQFENGNVGKLSETAN